MASYLRRDAARACPVHQAVLEECLAQLETRGGFSKDEVLDTLNMNTMASAIRWDYLREFIEGDHSCELVPVASRYFKRHARLDELSNPEKYLAQGYGKKTAGFVSVSIENDHLVVCRVRQRQKMANGVGEAFRNFCNKISARREQIGLENHPALEDHSGTDRG